MIEKIKVSKWFDEWLKEDYIEKLGKGNIISMIAVCKYYDNYYNYQEKIKYFNKQEYQEIRDRFENYVRAILDGNYEVEVEEEKTPLGWIPEENEDYYYVDINGEVDYSIYNSFHDRQVKKFTKIFKTTEEAEFEREKMKVTRELEKYASEFEPGVKNWFLEVEFEKDEDDYIAGYDLELDPCILDQYQGICFESIAKGREAIKAVGEDRILKYYFGVENE